MRRLLSVLAGHKGGLELGHAVFPGQRSGALERKVSQSVVILRRSSVASQGDAAPRY